jgi:hypothetical protein
MKLSLKSGRKLNFRLPEHETEKNGLRISPINDDLPLVNTLGTPKIGRLTGRSRRHDA